MNVTNENRQDAPRCSERFFHIPPASSTNPEGMTMFEADPFATLVINRELRVLNGNPAAAALLGFESPQALAGGFAALLQSVPDGKLEKCIRAHYDVAIEHGIDDFETELPLPGGAVPVRAILRRILYKEEQVVAACIVNAKHLHHAWDEVHWQANLLRQVNAVATRMLAAPPEGFEGSVNTSLATLGRSVGASRVQIWQNFDKEYGPYCEKIYEWAEEGAPETHTVIHTVDYADIPAWHSLLSGNQCINTLVEDVNNALREPLLQRNVKSLLLIPVMLHGGFWGLLSFEDCMRHRYFSEIEEKVLQSGGILVVSAILRDKITQNLVQARESALESARVKSDFLSRMSHEIRTPINAIVGMTAVAKRHSAPSKVNYCLDKISDASGQLLGLINHVLDMSKIEAGKFTLAPAEFNFEKMLQSTMGVVQVKAAEKQLNLHTKLESTFARNVYADELRLSQVILNLLSNAVKFTPHGGNITLHVSHTAKTPEQSTLRVEVEDNGIGIAEEEQERLFHSFEQADGSITRRFGGTGLGLAICREIVHLMNGSIWVESKRGEGARFIFEVEIGWGAAHSSGPPAARRRFSPATSVRILVADPSEDMRAYFRSTLGRLLLNCDTASSGREAVNMVRSARERGRPYDIVFLAWNMPGVHKGETVRRIRSIMEGNIAVAAFGTGRDFVAAQAAGYDVSAFLTKPILPSVMLNTIVDLTSASVVHHGAAEETRHHWPGRRVLLAEDLAINREILLATLEGTGLEVSCAENGHQALEMFYSANPPYDLVLMDIQMPELDGLAATRHIRGSAHSNSYVPIVAMTANAFQQDVDNCLAAGMNGHIAKPIELDLLLETLEEHLGQGEERRHAGGCTVGKAQ